MGCRPRVNHRVSSYGCALCNFTSFTRNSAVLHAKRLHGYSEQDTNSSEVVTEQLQSVYYCTLCDQPSRDSYRWQAHMKRCHNILVDRRRRSYANSKLHHRKRSASLKDKSVATIECVICQKKMRLTESYYFHIRRAHKTDEKVYAKALTHLTEVRISRKRKIKFTKNDLIQPKLVHDILPTNTECAENELNVKSLLARRSPNDSREFLHRVFVSLLGYKEVSSDKPEAHWQLLGL